MAARVDDFYCMDLLLVRNVVDSYQFKLSAYEDLRQKNITRTKKRLIIATTRLTENMRRSIFRCLQLPGPYFQQKSVASPWRDVFSGYLFELISFHAPLRKDFLILIQARDSCSSRL